MLMLMLVRIRILMLRLRLRLELGLGLRPRMLIAYPPRHYSIQFSAQFFIVRRQKYRYSNYKPTRNPRTTVDSIDPALP